MPAGLQAWDAQGRLVFDTNSRTIRIAGVLTIVSNGEGVITFTPSLGKELFVFAMQAGVVGSVEIQQTGPTSISWSTLRMEAGAEVNIFYGEA